MCVCPHQEGERERLSHDGHGGLLKEAVDQRDEPAARGGLARLPAAWSGAANEGGCGSAAVTELAAKRRTRSARGGDDARPAVRLLSTVRASAAPNAWMKGDAR